MKCHNKFDVKKLYSMSYRKLPASTFSFLDIGRVQGPKKSLILPGDSCEFTLDMYIDEIERPGSIFRLLTVWVCLRSVLTQRGKVVRYEHLYSPQMVVEIKEGKK